MPDTPSPEYIDIRRVAAEAGVSIATVSRVLNNPSRVSPATRERVMEVATQLGYRPNSLGQRLRTGKTNAIGMVFPTPHGHFADPFFFELLAGIGEALNQVGLDMLITTCPPGSNEIDLYRRLVEEQKVDGLVVARTRRHDSRIAYLLEQGIPFVVHGRSETKGQYSWLDVDSEFGFYQATGHLLGLGHHRIAMINAPLELNFAHLRLEGYFRALKDAGVQPDPQMLDEGDLSEEAGFRATQRFLALESPPSAILCANDQMALGALHALREKGLKAGKDISIIGYDDIPLASYCDPPLTTLRQPIRASGQWLVNALVAQIQGKREVTRELWLPEFVQRSSVGKV